MTQTLKGVFTVATQSSFSWSKASISTIQQPQWFTSGTLAYDESENDDTPNGIPLLSFSKAIHIQKNINILVVMERWA